MTSSLWCLKMGGKSSRDPFSDCRLQDITRLNDLIKARNKKGVLKLIKHRHISRDCLNSGFVMKYFMQFRELGLSLPVGLAARIGAVNIMNVLISHGFDPQEPCMDGTLFSPRPIHLACQYGHLPVVMSLITQHGVPIDSRDDDEKPPLFWAITECRVEIVKFLVQSGASVNSYCSKQGICPLHVVARESHTPKPVADNIAICKYLLSKGADANARNSLGNSPLHLAAKNGYTGVILALLASGAAVNAANNNHCTPFSWLARFETPFICHVFQLLYSHGADPDIRDWQGYTALHVVVNKNRYVEARFLVVNLNVCLHKRCSRGRSAFYYAVSHSNRPLVHLLITAGYDPGQEDWLWKNDDKLLQDPERERLIKDIRQVASVPRTLQDICCLRIRHILGRHLSTSVGYLQVPKRLQDAVKLTHIPHLPP